MYVIKGDVALKAVGQLYPAELCTFQSVQAADGTSYKLSNVLFYDPSKTSAAGDTEIAVANPILGFIAKTGRFVPTTSAI